MLTAEELEQPFFIDLPPANRILAPDGFERISIDENTFAEYLRQLPLKPNGSEVMLYDGRIKPNNDVYDAVVDLIIGNATSGGCIVDSAASLTFEDGYTYSFSPLGGYIDLYGVTAGSGAGGLALNIFDDVGTSYNPGDDVYIFSNHS